MKLNLGSGSLKLKDYENIDLIDGKAAYPLDYIEDGSCDEIRASHLLEHFGYEETFNVLLDWVSKLKVGGVLKVAVPDFKKIAKNYIDGVEQNTSGYLMGGHIDENDFHKSIFDEDSLRELFQNLGLDDIQTWQDGHDTCTLPISLNLQGTKTEKTREKPLKIAAVMSMPRLAFTDNVFTGHKAFLPLGIEFEKGTGVFWGQILTKAMMKNLDKDYIITCDYDSYFLKEHVVRLCQLMQENPDVDAIVPVQSQREGDNKLFGATSEQQKADGALVPIVTGHFGLTIFRTSALKQMTHPWLMGVPNKDGLWEEGRLDEDIFFWHKFHKEGFKAMLSKEVSIGHLQLMCSWPDTEENEYSPIHCYMNDTNAGKIPAHCIPNTKG